MITMPLIACRDPIENIADVRPRWIYFRSIVQRDALTKDGDRMSH